MEQEPTDEQKPKLPIVRGARACTTCRAAKMKCVGSDDGEKPCQRCARTNVECVFEKHRRGRKPGSKLSEASKMLRKLEKGLNSAKLKSQSSDGLVDYTDSRNGSSFTGNNYANPTTHFPSNELPPLSMPPQYREQGDGPRSVNVDASDNDIDRNDDDVFPVKVIDRERLRNSFFETILNPPYSQAQATRRHRSGSLSPPDPTPMTQSDIQDPISAGIIDEAFAKVLFDFLFLRLNPFINLFDATLHTVPYVRSKCPFLFTTLIMAGCKFFRPELFKPCQQLANTFAVKAFAEGWKRLEVVQAFACLTYWKDPHDNRTWTYIGYACRMAVELGLNRHVAHPSARESEFQLLERRNRERTYLVLFVHDRSLSTQTGRNWMLPEDEFIRHAYTWHEETGGAIRPEDVIIAAFVQLRRINAEVTDTLNTAKHAGRSGHSDVNYEAVLRNCNERLNDWMEHWKREMQRANGQSFHLAFLDFFRLYVRLFLNSFGIQDFHATSGGSVQALYMCYRSAVDILRLVKDFAKMQVLCYGQETITIMSAYAAVFLLRLLRSVSFVPHLHDGAAQEVQSLISQTAQAYQAIATASSSAAYHSRFLLSLLSTDVFPSRRTDQAARDDHEAPEIDPRLQQIQSPTYPQQQPAIAHNGPLHFPASPHMPAHPGSREDYPESHIRSAGTHAPMANGHHTMMYNNVAPHAPTERDGDAQYWDSMFSDLGFNPRSDDNHMRPFPPSAYPVHTQYQQ